MQPNSLIVRWLDKLCKFTEQVLVHFIRRPLLIREHLPVTRKDISKRFANIYRNVAYCIQGRLSNDEVDKVYTDFPTVQDGVRGMAFIDAVVTSGKQDVIKWIKMP
jgi:hypothetical protein